MTDPVWVDGVLRERSEATVDPFDLGFTAGDGLFETIRVTGGRPVFLDRHLARLRSSADRIGLTMEPDDPGIAEAAAELLEACRLTEARLRITLTGGVGTGGPHRTSPRGTLLITAVPAVTPPPRARVVLVPWVRNERSALAGVKSTSYGENVVMLRHVAALGADEALLSDGAGRLSEGIAANVFVAVGGALLTPSRDAGCLPGVIRQVLLDRGVATEADLPMAVVHEADEIFLTSSVRGVTPVSHVDDRALPVPEGPSTTAAMKELAHAVADDLAGSVRGVRPTRR